MLIAAWFRPCWMEAAVLACGCPHSTVERPPPRVASRAAAAAKGSKLPVTLLRV